MAKKNSTSATKPTRAQIIKDILAPIAKGLGLTFELDPFSGDILARCAGTGRECRITHEDVEDHQWERIREKFLTTQGYAENDG